MGEESQDVPPLPPRYRFRDLIWGENVIGDEDRVRVEFFTNEKSFKERLQLYFIKNQRSSLRIRIFNLFIKLLSCVLYMVRVMLDDPEQLHQRPMKLTYVPCNDVENTSLADPGGGDGGVWVPTAYMGKNSTDDIEIDWHYILWVNRHEALWGMQVTVAIISLTETLLLTYLGYKGNILQQILAPGFILEVINTVPFILTIFLQIINEDIRNLFVPVFFNCWLAKTALENMLNDLHRAMQRSQSALAQQLVVLCATISCLIFTSVCGIQHLQRGGRQQFNLFNSLWYVVVTFSTVGYGDFTPDIWPSKLFMIILIGAAFIVLPTQFEKLAFTWLERQKQGGTYSSHRAQNELHVVVVATQLHADSIMDFLNEFYAHPLLQNYFVVLLSPSELDPTMKIILQVPIWSQRVIYIQGSALKDGDLSRCRMQDAEASFMIAARNFADRNAADQHTILRSWAVKDFAPHCPQYVQIYRPENKLHVKFAEHVVCEDEFKYALLANNCLCPGASTLITLLLHTSRGAEGQGSSEQWMRDYGKHSGNEIYHKLLGDSKFFGEYQGKSFTFASFHAHRKYGVALVGIKQDMHGATIQLNPGPHHIMKDSDICFYMSVTKEENSACIFTNPCQEDKTANKSTGGVNSPVERGSSFTRVANMIAGVGTVAMERQQSKVKRSASSQSATHNSSASLRLPAGLTLQGLNRRPSIAPVPAVLEATGIDITLDSDSCHSIESASLEDDTDYSDYVRGFPPVTPYIGTSPTLCHLLHHKRPTCCLQLAQQCAHNTSQHAKQYEWKNRAIILTADYASNGLYNFIVPLRSHCRPKHTLHPIVLLLERRPEQYFLETISHFPLIYWMIGSIECLDDLLRAGITIADNVVIVNKESSNALDEETLADCNTIVAVQTIFRLFPNANIITELTQASNMRFMQFRAKDHYALQLSKLEKKEKDRGSHLYYMFRLPFAAGNVFSASMLDTLLYQAFVKDYLITFVRLLLGIDQAVGSGHLACMKIGEEDMWIRTYGRLYQKLCSTTCAVPIGIYRTQGQLTTPTSDSTSALHHHKSDQFAKQKDDGHSSRKSHSDKECAHCRASGRNRNSSFRRRAGHAEPSYTALLQRDEDATSDTIAVETQEISQMVQCRMESLNLPMSDYDDATTHRNTVSYPIINPNYDFKLQLNDVIYLIKPSSLSPHPSPLLDSRKRFGLMRRQEPTGAENVRPDMFDPYQGTSNFSPSGINTMLPPIVCIEADSDCDEIPDEMTSQGVAANDIIRSQGDCRFSTISEINSEPKGETKDSVVSGTMV